MGADQTQTVSRADISDFLDTSLSKGVTVIRGLLLTLGSRSWSHSRHYSHVRLRSKDPALLKEPLAREQLSPFSGCNGVAGVKEVQPVAGPASPVEGCKKYEHIPWVKFSTL